MRLSNSPPAHFIVCALALYCGSVVAGTTPSGCEDLSAYGVTPSVDFASQIQPIFDACTGCHGESGAADLDLRPGVSYANLVGVSATTNPARLRVEPFEPDESLLLSAVNCTSTGGPAFQMSGTTPEQRALIRDWIAQGAPLEPAPRAVPAGSKPGLVALIVLLMVFAATAARAGKGMHEKGRTG